MEDKVFLDKDLINAIYEEKLDRIKANLIVLWGSQQSSINLGKDYSLVISYKKFNDLFLNNGINLNKSRLKRELTSPSKKSIFDYYYDRNIKAYVVHFKRSIDVPKNGVDTIKIRLSDVLKITSKNTLVFYLNILGEVDKEFTEKIYSKDDMLELFRFDENAYITDGFFLRKDFEKVCLKKAIKYINENLDLNVTFERLQDLNAYYRITIQKKENSYNNDKELENMKDLFGRESKEGKTGRYNIIVGITEQMKEKGYSKKVIDVFIDYLLILFDTKHPFSLTTAERILAGLNELKQQGYLDEMLLEVIDNSRGKGWFSIYPLKDDVNRRMIIAGREAEKRSNLTDKDLLKEDNWLDRLENIK